MVHGEAVVNLLRPTGAPHPRHPNADEHDDVVIEHQPELGEMAEWSQPRQRFVNLAPLGARAPEAHRHE